MEKSFFDIYPFHPKTYMMKQHLLVDFADLHKEHYHMRQLAIHASSGDGRTCLMPCCGTFVAGRKWNGRADARAFDNKGDLVRMKTKDIGIERIIDLSSLPAQRMYFQHDFEIWGDYVRDPQNNQWLKRSMVNCEYLVMFRGYISVEIMEVVDIDRGEFVMPYKDALALV
jgi:hypothetical protein